MARRKTSCGDGAAGGSYSWTGGIETAGSAAAGRAGGARLAGAACGGADTGGGFALDPADRFLELEALARNLGGGQRRIDRLQLADQGVARLVVDRAARLRHVRLEAGNRPSQYGIVFGHLLRSAESPS